MHMSFRRKSIVLLWDYIGKPICVVLRRRQHYEERKSLSREAVNSILLGPTQPTSVPDKIALSLHHAQRYPRYAAAPTPSFRPNPVPYLLKFRLQIDP